MLVDVADMMREVLGGLRSETSQGDRLSCVGDTALPEPYAKEA
jgi:hypothetical protein